MGVLRDCVVMLYLGCGVAFGILKGGGVLFGR